MSETHEHLDLIYIAFNNIYLCTTLIRAAKISFSCMIASGNIISIYNIKKLFHCREKTTKTILTLYGLNEQISFLNIGFVSVFLL